jgi:hypothetical protein
LPRTLHHHAGGKRQDALVVQTAKLEIVGQVPAARRRVAERHERDVRIRVNTRLPADRGRGESGEEAQQEQPETPCVDRVTGRAGHATLLEIASMDVNGR